MSYFINEDILGINDDTFIMETLLMKRDRKIMKYTVQFINVMASESIGRT